MSSSRHQNSAPHIHSQGRAENEADALLRGDAEEVRRFFSITVPCLRQRLLARCWGERARRLADGVVDDVVSECFGGFATVVADKARKPLLLSYSGDGSFEGWLWKVLWNRYLSRARSAEQRNRVEVDPFQLLDLRESPSSSWGDRHTIHKGIPEALDQDALSALVPNLLEELAEEDPEGVVWIRLHYFHGIRKNQIARVWKVAPSTVGRQITRTLSRLLSRLTAAGKSPTNGASEAETEATNSVSLPNHYPSRPTKFSQFFWTPSLN